MTGRERAELLDRLEVLEAACERLARQRDAALTRATRAESRLAVERDELVVERARLVGAERWVPPEAAGAIAASWVAAA